VDIGAGTPADYERRDVKGAIVLTTEVPSSVQHEAVAKRGAVGIVSYWSPPSRAAFPDQVQWLDTANNREAARTFGFVLSPRQGKALKDRLAAQPVRLRAFVDADLGPGTLEVVSGVIPGRDRGQEEVILVAHICHFIPSSNDNASGCGLLLELARTWQLLIDKGVLAPPARTIRFMWVPENHGTIAYLYAHPELTERVLGALSLDMVGEDLDKCGSMFRFVRTPDSRPSVLNDVLEHFTSLVGSLGITTPTGSRSPFRYVASEYIGGSDHAWFNDGGVGIPAMLLMHWPDNFYHSSEDAPDKVDPTELKRIALVAFGTARYLGSAVGAEVDRLAAYVATRGRGRVAEEMGRAIAFARTQDQVRLARSRLEMVVDREARAVASSAALDGSVQRSAVALANALRETGRVMLEDFDRRFLSATSRPFPGGSRRYRRTGRYLSAAWRTHFTAALSGDELAKAVAFERSLPYGDFSVAELLNLMDGTRTLAEIAQVVETEGNGEYLWDEYFGNGSMQAPPPYSSHPIDRAALLDFVSLAQKAGLLAPVNEP
jgi:hypothetical protein